MGIVAVGTDFVLGWRDEKMENLTEHHSQDDGTPVQC